MLASRVSPARNATSGLGIELVVMPEDALLVEGNAAIRGQVGFDARPRRNSRMVAVWPIKSAPAFRIGGAKGGRSITLPSSRRSIAGIPPVAFFEPRATST